MSNLQDKRKARQDDVYAAAAKLFAEKGYHATRIQDIADELGMLKGSLYYYFSSKEDLLVNIASGRIEESIAAMKGILSTKYSPTEKLTLAIDEHLRLHQEHADIYMIYMQENLHEINADAAEQVSRLTRAYQKLWEGLLCEGIECGEFQADLDTEIAVKGVLSMCNHTIVWYDPNGRVPIRELAKQFANLVLNGVRP